MDYVHILLFGGLLDSRSSFSLNFIAAVEHLKHRFIFISTNPTVYNVIWHFLAVRHVLQPGNLTC